MIEKFMDFTMMVMCWTITGFISYMGYNREFDLGPAIVIGIILVFISLFATLLFFIPKTVHRFVFGGNDRKFW